MLRKGICNVWRTKKYLRYGSMPCLEKSVASPVHDRKIAMGAGSTLTESPNIYIYLPKYYKVGTGKPHERDYIHYYAYTLLKSMKYGSTALGLEKSCMLLACATMASQPLSRESESFNELLQSD